jgi:hypothetical protein
MPTTFVFKHVHQWEAYDYAWTEVYYQQAGSIAAARATYTALFLSFMSATKGTFAHCNTVRISDTANNRNALSFYVSCQGSQYSASPYHPDIKNTCGYVQLRSVTPPLQRPLMIRGLPDEVTVRDELTGVSIPALGWEGNVNNWITVLQSRNFGIRGLQPLGTAPYLFYPVSQVMGTNGTGQVVITTPLAGAAGLPSPLRVIVSQVNNKQLPGFNGHYNVLSATGTTFTIPYNIPATGTVPITKGRIRIENYVFGPIDVPTSGFVRFSSRDTKELFAGGRGRRSGTRIKLV